VDNAEWVKLISRVPEAHREILTLMMRSGTEIALQTVLRTDDHFVVVRGRLSGTTDQDRIFFVPYDQIVYAGFTRPVPLPIIAGMFGENPAPVVKTLEI
jgi:mannose-6-phosphate isomerase-like protein (cupin superfamily)